jgi:steroid delta-isomerase-like uncharacterized protein
MSATENMATVRRSIEEQFGPGDVASLDRYHTADIIIHDPANADSIGQASNRAFVAELRAAYPDATVVIEDLFAAGDRVAARSTFRGTNAEPLAAGGPTGIAVEITGITIARLHEGRIAEEWVEWDAHGLSRQLAPEPAPPAEGRRRTPSEGIPRSTLEPNFAQSTAY